MDAAGNSYVTGETQSNDFPVARTAFQRTKSGGIHVTEAFVSKIALNWISRLRAVGEPELVLAS